MARKPKKPGDMVRSLGLVFAFVLVLLLIGPGRVLLFPGHSRVHTVGTRDATVAADRLAGRHLPAPVGLPGGWRATSARVDGSTPTTVHLHIGYVTPKGQYAALEESTGDPNAFAAAQLGHPVTGPSADTPTPRVVGGRLWAVHRDAKGETAYLSLRVGIAVIVLGSASDAELRVLAASLR